MFGSLGGPFVAHPEALDSAGHDASAIRESWLEGRACNDGRVGARALDVDDSAFHLIGIMGNAKEVGGDKDER